MTTDSPRVTTCELPVTHPEGQRELFCDITVPVASAKGTLVIAHGFKGYKDYGMFPHLAWTAALHGWAAIRFNFAHSGMTRSDSTFERPDLFALDTWNRQVDDLEQLVAALRVGAFPECPPEGPVVLFGHSRGGLAAILAAGRGLAVDAVLSASAPKDPLRFSSEDRARLRAEGSCPVESSRTGQVLSIGGHFLEEVEQDSEFHDPCVMAGRMAVPLIIVHGDADETVSCDDARALAQAAGGQPVLVPGGTHVFNVPNPLDAEASASPQLAVLESVLVDTLDLV